MLMSHFIHFVENIKLVTETSVIFSVECITLIHSAAIVCFKAVIKRLTSYAIVSFLCENPLSPDLQWECMLNF